MRLAARILPLPLLVLAAACTPPPPGPVAATVDCGAGDSINAAIAAGATSIGVTGVCAENVVIDRDGVAIYAAASGAGIKPTGGSSAVRVSGAQNVVITGLTLDGTATSNHVVSMRHSDAILEGVTVTGGKAAGIYVSVNSSANVQAATVTGNDTAITVINNSSANITAGTRIEKTRYVALISSRSSSVNMGGGSVIDGVDNGEGVAVAASAHFLLRENAAVRNVGGRAISAEGSSVEISQGTVEGATGDAIRAVGASSVMLDRATITGNGGRGVRLEGSSGGEYRLSTITGNAGGAISQSPDSEFIDRGGNTVGP